MNEDPYRVLGISRGATEDEVKAAYRKLAKEYHPDRNGGSASAEAKMKEINDAYAKVMDELRHGGSSSYGGGSYGGQSYGGSSSYGGGYGSSWGGYNGYAGGYGSGYGGNYGGSPQFTAVRNYLANRRFAEAMNALNSIPTRNGEWYYCAAQAMLGMGNRVAALDYAQQAVNMEPTNAAYADLLSRIEYASGGYSQQSADFGGINCVPCVPCVGGGNCFTYYLLCQALSCCCRPCCY